MSHRFHPDPTTSDPPEALLWDDCLDCAYHAEEILSLDDTRLTEFTELAERVTRGDAEYRTRTEARAGRFFEKRREVTRRLGF